MRGVATVDLDAVGKRRSTGGAARSLELSRRPGAGDRHRHAARARRPRPLRAAVGRGGRRAGPEGAPAGTGVGLRVRAGSEEADRPRRRRSSCRRASGRSTSAGARPSSCNSRGRLQAALRRLAPVPTCDPSRDRSARQSASIPEGRWPAQGRRSQDAPASSPSKTCSTGCRSATRTAAGCSRSPRCGRAPRRPCSARSRARTLAITRRRGFRIFHAVLGDASGAIRCTWMNQAFLADILKPHDRRRLRRREARLDGLHFLNPEYEIVADDLSGLHTGRIVPFYEKTGTVTPNMQRKLVRQALDELPAELPDLLADGLRGAPAAGGAAGGDRGQPLSGERRRRRRAQRVSHAGAAPADLRGVLPLSDRPCLAAPRRRASS